MNNRLVALIDMDCFYCQVETRLNPSLKGKPMAVVQYNQWKGGGIIAVNYEARDRGVTRHMRGEEAKRHCPEIQLVSVPCVRGKADLTKYRDAGREVIKVICEFSKCVQRASVDEAYIDLTEAVDSRLALKTKISPVQLENTFVVGYSPEGSNNEEERDRGVVSWLEEVYSCELRDPELHRLATAAALVEEMRTAVFNTTGFHCSAGISHNKILAKLVCGLHKPRRQTVLPMSSVPELYRSLPVKKVRNLGGKLGDDVVDRLGVTHMAELSAFSEKQLQDKYDEKTGSWLYNIARGIDLDPVTPQLISKSIGCRKNFPGKTALSCVQNVTHWISELSAEVAERLDEDLHMNKRKAQLMTVHFCQEVKGRDVAMSRSVPLPGYEAERIAACAFNVLSKYNSASSSSDLWDPPLKYLGISTGKFMEFSVNANRSIDKFFKAVPSCSKNILDNNVENETFEKRNVNESVQIEKFENPSTEQTRQIKGEVVTNVCDGVQSHSNGSSDIAPKAEGRSSFFERYFKNQPNKIIRKSPLKTNHHKDNASGNQERSDTASTLNVATDKINGENNDIDLIHQNMNDNSCKEKESIANSDSPVDSSELNQESWISPTELFPDFDNIDDSIMDLLPSPMQRKIKCVKGNQPTSSENQFLCNRLSRDSDCAPTKVETVADVYPTPGKSTAATSLSKCIKSSVVPRTEAEEEDLIEPESLFDRTSLDLFESQSNQFEEESQSVRCDECKELISKFELQEHLDHHMALKLQEEFNKQPQPNRTVSESRTSKVVLSDKKKRGRPSKKEIVPTKKSRTIMSFFTRA